MTTSEALLAAAAAGGRDVSLTNLANNGNFSTTAGWSSSGASFTVSGNIASFLANSAVDILQQSLSVILNHKYYFCEWVKAAVGANITAGISDGAVVSSGTSYGGSGEYEFLSAILTAGRTSTSGITWCLVDNRSSGWNTVNAKYVSIIDLTVAFGAGNEPTKAQMDVLMDQFANKWLNGTQTETYFW